MVIDTQGSELLILQLAVTILGGFNYIQVEAANFEAYRNWCHGRHAQYVLTQSRLSAGGKEAAGTPGGRGRIF